MLTTLVAELMSRASMLTELNLSHAEMRSVELWLTVMVLAQTISLRPTR